MANELQTRTTADSTVYLLVRNSSGLPWNGSAFVSEVDANWGAYAIATTQQGHTGFYSGSFPTAITTPGIYAVEFFKQAGGSPAITDTFVAGGSFVWSGGGSVSPSGTNLCSLATCQLVTTITDTVNLTSLIPLASSVVQSYCRRDFAPTSYTENYDGLGSLNLILNQRPITALTTVTLDVNDAKPEVIDGSQYVIDAKVGLITLKSTSTATPWFREGRQNIQVVYTAGFATIPNNVQTATAMLVGHYYRLRSRDLGMAQEKIGDWQGWFRTQGGIPEEIADLLRPYRGYV